MPGYKYSNIDSGATPIGSAGRAPDRNTIFRKNSTKRDKERRRFEQGRDEEEKNWSL
jgi:hypothetical protein